MLREFTTRESKISELKVSSDTQLLFISTDRLLRSEAEPEYFHVHEKLCVSLTSSGILFQHRLLLDLLITVLVMRCLQKCLFKGELYI